MFSRRGKSKSKRNSEPEDAKEPITSEKSSEVSKAELTASDGLSEPNSTDDSSPLTPYLTIQPPISESTIEFNQVYRVSTEPLDQVLQGMPVQDDQDDKGERQAVEEPLRREIDSRPKIWYEACRLLWKQLQFANEERVLAEGSIGRITAALTEGKFEEDVTQEQLEEKRRTEQKKYFKTLNEIQGLIAKRDLLLQEIRQNGYEVETLDAANPLHGHPDIRSQGYPIQICRLVSRTPFTGVDVDPELPLGSDEKGQENWENVRSLFYQQFIHSGLLQQKKGAEFLKHLTQLDSTEPLSREAFLTVLIDSLSVSSERQKQFMQDIHQLDNVETLAEVQKHRQIIELSQEVDDLMRQDEELGVLHSTLANRMSQWEADKNDLKELKGSDLRPDQLWSMETIGSCNLTEAKYDKDTSSYPVHPVLFEKANTLGVPIKKMRMRMLEFDVTKGAVVKNFNRSNYSPGNDEERTSGRVGSTVRVPAKNPSLETSEVPIYYDVSGWGLYSPPVINSLQFIVTAGVQAQGGVGFGFHSNTPLGGLAFSVEYPGSERIEYGGFFQEAAIQMCEKHIADNLAQMNEIDRIGGTREANKKTLDAKIAELDNLKTTLIGQLRHQFIQRWNDPQHNQIGHAQKELVLPDEQPLADFLASFKRQAIQSGPEAKVTVPTIHRFNSTANGVVNEYGQSLRLFLREQGPQELANIVLILPKLDVRGKAVPGVHLALSNPAPPVVKTVRLRPTIRFVETYEVITKNAGMAHGRLSYTVCLLPGETKEIVLKRETSLKRKTTQSQKESTTVATRETSSFEEELEHALSTDTQQAQETEQSSVAETVLSDLDQTVSSHEETDSSGFGVKVGLSGLGIGGSSDSTETSRRSHTKEKAFKDSHSQQEVQKTRQSNQTLARDVQKTIQKVASETNRNNTIEFNLASEDERTEFNSRTETLRVQNLNTGKPVTYQFFQLENKIDTETRLTDAHVVINTGVEVLEGTVVYEEKVFNITELGEIYDALQHYDPSSTLSDYPALLAAFVVQEIVRHYCQVVTEDQETYAILQPEESQLDGIKAIVEIIQNVFLASKDGSEPQIQALKGALMQLASMTFHLVTQTVAQSTVGVSTGNSYHVEAHVAHSSAIEPYLENRRVIETKMKQAELAHQQAETKHLEARTEASQFQQIPRGVTHLALVPGMSLFSQQQQQDNEDGNEHSHQHQRGRSLSS